MSNVAVHARLDPILDRIQNSLVRLMGYDQVQLIDIQPVLLTCSIQAGNHRPDGFTKDFPTFHLNEAIVQEGNR